MGRIEQAYIEKFRILFQQIGAHRIDQGLDWMQRRARRNSRERNISFGKALTFLFDTTRRRVERVRPLRLRHLPLPEGSAILFLCDVGLGGLARWLRAAGYDSVWIPGIEDAALIREAERLSAILLTTDSGMMERRVLRDGVIPAVWVSPTLTMLEQLGMVLSELRLPILEPRCMRCGGRLEPVDKESVRERIPPRTYRWRNEYYLCTRCHQLFWRGSHWERIQEKIARVTQE